MFFSEIRIQEGDFDLSSEMGKLRKQSKDIGALVSFVGCVRDDGEGIQALELEHYPQMSEKKIQEHIEKASMKWPLLAVSVIHRVGRINLGEQIVLVLVASEHRDAAFEASQFLMDYLKADAPFWKKQIGKNSERWVEAKKKDQNAKDRWS